MQKKIVAAICAAALALAMPMAAFAANESAEATVNGSVATITADQVKDVKSGNATLKNFALTASSKYVNYVEVASSDTAASNYQAYSNDLATATFEVDAYQPKGKGLWKGNVDSVSFDIVFDKAYIDSLPTTVDPANLWTRGYVKHSDGGTQDIASQKGSTLKVAMTRMSTVTAVLSNGPLSYGQPVGQNNTKDLDDAAKNGNVSPKTGEIAA